MRVNRSGAARRHKCKLHMVGSLIVMLATALPTASLTARAQTGVPGARVAQPSVSTQSNKNGSRGQRLADTAISYIGCAYKWGGVSPKTGLDCSGLVVAVCKQWGINMPHSVLEQYRQGKDVARDQLEPGDIIFFKDTYKPGLSHVAVYVGGNRYVCAGDEKAGVVMFEFGPEGEAHFAGARRLDLSKIPPVKGNAAEFARIPATPTPQPSPGRANTAIVNVRVCIDSGDRANSACPAYRVIKTTAAQSLAMKTCARHHPAPGEKR